ncbi:MAG: organomercurial lyase [Acidimicrobiia bacterium]
MDKMEKADLELRNATYHSFAELGRAPSAGEVAGALGISLQAVKEGWRRLHEAHALVLDDKTGELLMANPFAARETEFKVSTGERIWFANCAWDAFGIGAALRVDSTIETVCPDCSHPIRLSVTDGVPDDEAPVFHVLVPAARWWDDITHT